MLLLERIEHRGNVCVAIRGRLSDGLYNEIRNDRRFVYTKTHRCYYFIYNRLVLESIRTKLSAYSAVSVRGFEELNGSRNIEVPVYYEELLRRLRYSDATIANYVIQFRTFLEFIYPLGADEFDDTHVHRYLLHLINDRKYSISTQNMAINAIKFYLEKVNKRERQVYYIERPRKELRLPVVLSEEEVCRLFEKVTNLKHRCTLWLLYSSGLRVSELINLRWADLDTSRMLINVWGGKGRKDRITLFSKQVCALLTQYRQVYKPEKWVFEGAGNTQYSAKSINTIIKRAARKAGIEKRVSAHTLRHSFATHLLETGTDIRYIQTLLGHESSRTTELYAHVTKKGFAQLQSPLDRMIQNGILADKTDI